MSDIAASRIRRAVSNILDAGGSVDYDLVNRITDDIFKAIAHRKFDASLARSIAKKYLSKLQARGVSEKFFITESTRQLRSIKREIVVMPSPVGGVSQVNVRVLDDAEKGRRELFLIFLTLILVIMGVATLAIMLK
jgi:hypothetical protein